jgi:hypothetical protein
MIHENFAVIKEKILRKLGWFSAAVGNLEWNNANQDADRDQN